MATNKLLYTVLLWETLSQSRGSSLVLKCGQDHRPSTPWLVHTSSECDFRVAFAYTPQPGEESER